MKQYEIFFEIFGKKLKTTITARNEMHAKELIAQKIIFHKIAQQDPTINKLKNMFGML